MFLDTQLHRCVYDRKYSLLKELPNLSQEEFDNEEDFEVLFLIYLLFILNFAFMIIITNTMSLLARTVHATLRQES